MKGDTFSVCRVFVESRERECEGVRRGVEPTLGQIQLKTNSLTTRSAENTQQWSTTSENP